MTIGHKCTGARTSCHVNCECGWSSSNWCQDNARRNAYAEWRWHVAAASGDGTGHKCIGARKMHYVKCECGWGSGHNASRRDAYAEWRWHVSNT